MCIWYNNENWIQQRNPQLCISHWFGHTESIKARHILWCDTWHPSNTFDHPTFLTAPSAQPSDDRTAGSGPQNLMVADQEPHPVGCLLGHLSCFHCRFLYCHQSCYDEVCKRRHHLGNLYSIAQWGHCNVTATCDDLSKANDRMTTLMSSTKGV